MYGIEQAFLEELQHLHGKEPGHKLRNLLGRLIEGQYQEESLEIPEGLSGTKIGNRAKVVQHQHGTISFVIERHPTPIPCRQRWEFNTENRTLSLISEEPTYLDCEQAASRLGLTPGTVRKYIKKGKLKAQRASDIESIDYWFEDKLNRDKLYRDNLYLVQNQMIRPNKWLIDIDELSRFQGL
ncbi:hypothetical protein ACFLVE_04305 [Chloroflexota bacterium]